MCYGPYGMKLETQVCDSVSLRVILEDGVKPVHVSYRLGNDGGERVLWRGHRGRKGLGEQ